MGKTIGLDLGEARVGIAVADDLGFMAHARKTLDVRKGDTIALLKDEIESLQASTVVVGLPRKMDGTEGPAADKTREIVEKLKAACPGKEFIFQDERLTTVAAQKQLHQAGRNTKSSRSVIDQVAAQQILQGYLDAQALQSGGMMFPDDSEE